MHWGHATSRDLLHWEEHPIAISPPRHGDWAFSGSAVIDKRNTAGFGKDALVAVYTSTGRGECLKYSLDGGMTFKEYAGNPVLEHIGRDPKVFWYEPKQHWVMVVFDETRKTMPDGSEQQPKTLQIHTSKDLKAWTYRSEHGPFWECPELFELPVDGDENNKKWVMHSANAQYYIGSFDGYTFTPESPRYEFKDGSHYASQTWNNTPDGRRIMQAWGAGVATPGMPFNQLMLFPTELRLATTEAGVRLLAHPIRELETLHRTSHVIRDTIINVNEPLVIPPGTAALHVIMKFTLADTWNAFLTVNGYELGYHTAGQKFNDRFVRPIDDKVRVEVIADRTSIEVFVNDGEYYLSKPNRTPASGPSVQVHTTNPGWMRPQRVLLDRLEVYELASIWGE